MPRRKQNCPKRMKWELENAERAALQGGGMGGQDGDKKPDGELSGGSDDNDQEMGSDSEDSSSSPPSPTTPSPRSHKNGAAAAAAAILDFSRGSGPLPATISPPSMISPLSNRKQSHRESRDRVGESGRGSNNTRPGGDSPLDLSVSHKKPAKDDTDGGSGPLKKLPKWSPLSLDPLGNLATTTPLLATNHHPHNREVQHHRERKNSWNGNHSPDIKALEKMSEMSRGSGGSGPGDGGSSAGGKLTSPSGRGNSGSSSSWQAQWLAQNSGSRDIFKCVVCRNTFSSLQALSIHMKESKHGPPMPNLPSPKNLPQQSPSHGHGQGSQQHGHPHSQQSLQPPRDGGGSSAATSGSQSAEPSSPSLLLKGTGGGHKVLSPYAIAETVQLPRKLVRGQDVWLGKGAEQTRQILKCMWCGQSFRSLAEMTSHMQQTQHYTNIISQEQLISWRSSDDKGGPASANSHVSAVLTCKVCEQAFASLKELSNHMVKNSHYKEHIMRSITESGSRRRQSREKRKKSLPVRKLLELERANQEMKINKEIRISCEKCSEKIPGPLFVEHLRVCGSLHHHPGHNHSGGESSGGSSPLKQPTPSPKLDGGHSGCHSGRESSGTGELDLSIGGGGGNKDKSDGGDHKNESSSSLNAIEKMIEKSFDYRSGARSQATNNLGPSPPSHIGTRSAPSTLTILKRLGIDESVDYTKPLLDPGQLPLPPSSKYHNPFSSTSTSSRGRSRSRSVSSDKSFSEEMAARVSRNSKSNSNSSSPALTTTQDHESVSHSHSIKSPLSLQNSGKDRSTPASARSPDSNISTDVEGDGGLSDHDDLHDDNRDRGVNLRQPLTEKGIAINKSSSLRSNNNHSSNNKKSHSRQQPKEKKASSQNSLSALSSMFESIGGGGGGRGADIGSGGGDHNNANSKNSSGFPSNSHHPLAALQKLCDKTENTPGNGGGGEGGRGSVNSRPTSTSSSNPQSSPEPSLLGLNWATAAANQTSNSAGDGTDGNVFKCTFCDTPFLSKGAYRLHLAKMHFVKESSKSPATTEINSNNGGGGNGKDVNSSPIVEQPTINSTDSPASKLIKYAELAKQLSSK